MKASRSQAMAHEHLKAGRLCTGSELTRSNTSSAPYRLRKETVRVGRENRIETPDGLSNQSSRSLWEGTPARDASRDQIKDQKTSSANEYASYLLTNSAEADRTRWKKR